MMGHKPANRIAMQQTGKGGSTARRLRLLGSSSALACAIAVASVLSSPAAAQSITDNMPRIPTVEVPLPWAAGAEASRPVAHDPSNDFGGISRPSTVPLPLPTTRDVTFNHRNITFDAPTINSMGSNGNQAQQPPVSIAPAQAPVVNPPIGQSGAPGSNIVRAAGPQVSRSSTPAPSPGDTDTNGINVQASANYFASEIDFAPDTAADVVDVLASTAIINWTTFIAGTGTSDVTFLGAGGNLQFTSALGDYTVLNRIFTPGIDSAVRIDGSITSSVLGGAQTGGNLWFYSPGGIVIGSSGSFDVGGLLLTSSNINSIDAGGSQMNFTGVAEPDTAVVIEAGATINANQNGSYVAMVAPRVEQGGAVTVNGSAAYVGAEQAQLTINNGLFDISVGLGSEDANGIVHTGTTTGRASQATVDGTGTITDADARAIYMVAVPKNNAMTMLVGGNIGYQAATAAARTENGTIILSAGADVANTGSLSAPSITIDSENATGDASIEFTNGSLTSDIIAVAAQDLTIFPQFGQAISVGSDGLGAYALNLTAGGTITLGAGIGGTLTTDGDINLRAGLGQAVGGTVNLQAVGNVVGPFDPVFGNGLVDIGGNLSIDASGVGRDDFFTIRNNGGTGIGEDAVGGTIDFDIMNNAIFNIGGNLVLDASAQGGKGEVSSGNATGGSITITQDSGTLDVTGAITLAAGAIDAGTGKIGGSGPAALGSDGIGGNVAVDLSGGTLTAGALSIDVSGEGTTGSDDTQIQDNQGIAGDVSFTVTGGSHTIGTVTINAIANDGGAIDADGNTLSGGAGRGTVAVEVSGTDSTLNISSDLDINATTSGAIIDAPGTTVSLVARNTGTSGGILVGDEIEINTSAGNGSDTGLTTAGSISVVADGSTITFDDLDFDSVASPSGFAFFLFGNGRDFQGGDITILSTNGGNISGRTASLVSSATGTDASGGDGTAGNINITADNGQFALTQRLFARASGQGGAGFDPNDPLSVGVGQGGDLTFTVRGAAGALGFGDISANTDGSIFADVEGGFGGPGEGNGGNGIAGNVSFNIEGGTFNADDVSVSADGFGGDGGDISGLPSAFEPDVAKRVNDGAVNLAGLFAAAPGGTEPVAAMIGAPGAGSGGRGGDGVGGTVEVNLTGGSMTVNSFEVTADGIGGDGAFGDFDSGTATGDGGDAFGGNATFNAINGSLTVTNQLSVTARGNTDTQSGDGGFGNGVAGGAGGSATGGTAIFNMNGTATIAAGTVLVSADAFGGEGGTGDARFDTATSTFVPGEAGGDAGSGTGGTAVFNNDSGTITFGRLTVSANGQGGEGGGSFAISTGEATNNGGVGGDGIGGIATINLNQDDGTDPTYIAQATATGGQGGSGLDSGAGGSATGGTARINVNNVNVNLTSAMIVASAQGGAGGQVDGDGGDGGVGGDALAGSAILDVNGAAGVLTSTNAITMQADALGGVGANGSDLNIGAGGATLAGVGGAGGNAEAGLVQIIARDGATATYQTDGTTSANSSGGDGGDGGIDFVNFIDVGVGGDAGGAIGGTVELLADNGGNLNIVGVGGAAQFSADATGADGGTGGSLTLGLEAQNGANGATQGGEIALVARGPGSALNLLSDLQVSATATGAADTRTQSTGADASGGAFSIEVDDSGVIAANGSVTFTGNAIGANGLFNPGNATGGSVDINVLDGSLSLNDLTVTLQGTGTDAQNDFNGTVGDAGSGTGGDVSIDLADTGTLNIQTFFADVSGFGGAGSDDGVDATEGAGGDGTGGSMVGRFSGTLNNLSSFTVQATGSGGNAGNAGDGSDGANGGSGTGGSIDVEFSGTGPLLTTAPDLFLFSNASGGTGGAGGQGDMFVDAGQGGAGGSADGGSIRLAISGTGASADLGSATATLDSGANGGTGGRGGNNFGGGTAGDGGSGGAGTGGTTVIAAGSGSTLTLANGANIGSNGTGGTGGQGGGIDMASGGFAGTGGNGGTGTGGSPTLRATGGTIQGGDLQLTGVGFGGDGGTGGDDGLTVIGAQGDGGSGVGGSPALEILDGSPGIITFNNVDLIANGAGGAGALAGAGLGGLVTITDLSVDPAGLITLGSLDVDASGAASVAGGGFVMSSGSGPITITNGMTINTAGDITFDFDGDGQVIVGGVAQLFTDGNVSITHSNNVVPTISIDAGSNFTSVSGGSFTSAPGSIVDAANEMFIIAGGNIIADDLRAVPFIVLQARGSVALNNAVAAGPQGLSNLAGITIDAGLDTTGPVLYDPNENVTITGTVQSYQNIAIRSGGNATFAAGSTTIADNRLTVRTGDDIVIAAGATLTAANNPTDPVDAAAPFGGGPNMNLLAGDVTNLLSVPLTPIASIIADGTINSNTGSVVMSGNAIDALDATITASSLAADINDAPANGVARSDDGGMLNADCVEGAVCFGNISADNRIEIGQNSNNDVIDLIIEQGTVNAQDILVTTRSDIVMGTNGIATALGASNQFSATSTEGDVDLRDAAITSDTIIISAAGSLMGTSSLTSTNNIQIDVGQDVNATLIDTGGQLIDGTGSTFAFNVPGSINVGTYNLGDREARIIAGNNITIGAVNTGGDRDIRLTAANTAAGDVFLGTATGGRSVVLRGDNIGFTNLAGSQSVSFVTAGTITGGSLSSGGLMTLDGASINVGDLTPGFILNIDARNGDITTGNITSPSTANLNATGSITTGNLAVDGGPTLIAGGNINVGDVTTTGGVAFIRLDAGGTLGFGDIDGSSLVNLDGTAITGGNVTGAAQISIDGTAIDVNDVQSTNGFVNITSTAGDVVTGAVTSDQFGVTVTSAANNDLGDVTANGSINITSVGNTIVGDAAAGSAIGIDVDGDLTSGQLEARTTSPGLTIRVDGDANIAGATTNGLLTLTVLGALTGGDFTGASLSRLTAASIDINSATSVDQSLTVDATAGSAIVGSTSSNSATTVTATGDVNIGDATAGTSVTLRGDNVTLDSGNITNNLTLDATNGNVSGTGTILVGNAIDVDATGNIAVGSLDAQGGNFTADAGGTIGFTAATASGDVLFTTNAAISGGDVNAGGTARIDGGDIALGDVSAADIDLTSAAGILFDGLTSPSAITVTAANGVIGANTGNGDIDSGDDVTLTAESMALGNITSAGSVAADATNGDASFGTVDANTDISISATGTPTVANAISGGNTSITGASVALNNGTVGGNLTLNATAGDIDGNGTVTVGGAIDFDATGNVGFGTLDAQGGNFAVDAGGDVNFGGATSSADVLITAVGAVNGGDVTATGAASVNAAEIALGNVSADSIGLTSGADILFNSLTSPNAIAVTAANGTIGANTGDGDIDSDGDVSLTAQTIALNDISSGGSVSADATAGDASFRTINAANDASVSATGTASLADVVSGGNTSITGATVAVNSGTIGGDLLITATDGDIDLRGATPTGGGVLVPGGPIVSVTTFPPGLFTVSGAIDLNASDNVNFGRLTAQGGNFTVNAGQDVGFDGAAATGNVAMTAGGSIAAPPTLGNNIDATGDVILNGTSIDIASISAGGGVSAATMGGNIDVLNIDAIGLIDLTSDGSIFVDHAETDGDFTADAAGNVTTGLNSIITGGDIVIAGDIVDLGNSSAGGLVDVTGSQIDFVTLVAGTTVDLETINLNAVGIPSNGSGNITGVDLTAGPGASALSAIGSIDISGNTQIAGSLAALAGSNIGFGSAMIQGGDFTADAGGAIAYTSASATGTLDFVGDAGIFATDTTSGGAAVALSSGGGDVTVQDVQTNGRLEIDSAGVTTLNNASFGADGMDIDAGGNVALVDAAGPGEIIITSSGTIDFANLTSTGGGEIAVGADGAVTGQNIQGDGQVDVEGATVNLQNVTAADAARVRSLTGDLAVGDVSSTNDAARIQSAGALTTGGVNAGTIVELTGAGDIAVGGAITAATDATVTSTNGTVTADDITSAGATTVTGTDITLGDVNAGSIGLNSDTDILFDSLTSPSAISVVATNGTIGANTGSGDIDSGGNVDLAARSIAVGNVTSGGSVSADATAGDASFGAVDATNNVTVAASGAPTFTSVTSGGDTSVTGASVAFSNGSVGGSLSLTSTVGDVTGTGQLTAGQDIAINSAGNIGFDDIATPTGAFAAIADGDVTLNSVAARDGVSLTSLANGAISVDSISSDQDIQVSTGGAFAATDVTGDQATSVIDISASNGITIDTLTGRSATLVSDAASVRVDTNVDVAELISASGTGVSLVSLGDMRASASASAGNVDINADGDLSLEGVDATGNITIASGGSTTVNGAAVITGTPGQGGTAQSVQQTVSTGGNISFNVGGDLVVNSVVNAANDLDMSVAGLIDLQAAAYGQTITGQSADINIGTSGSLGRSDITQSIDLFADDSATLGGTGGASAGYALDNDEFSRVHSGGDFALTSPDGSITIDDLDVSVATGNGGATDGSIGQAGSVTLTASDTVDVIGDATIGNAAADNAFNITAGAVLSIDTDNGNLRVEDGTGAITGTINLTGESIVAASTAAQGDIASGSVADADARLGQNDGATRDDGYIQGGTVTFTVDDALLIQNSGAGTDFDDRRGVVADNVTVNSTTPDAAIVFNGVVGGNTGIDAIAVTGVPTGFDTASTINGCLILDPASCVPAVADPGTSVDEPVQDLIEDRIEDSAPTDTTDVLSTIIVELRNDPERALDPLIDEPVTGAGNEDLWVSDEEECDASDPTCEVEEELEPAE